MDGRISQVALVVRDQAKALEFYTNRVGFEKKTDLSPPGGVRWVTVGPKGQDLELALWQVGSRTDPREPSANWRPGASPAIVVRVPDCRRTFDELKARGVPFEQDAPGEFPWGIVATFADPDGNRFSLWQNRGGP